MNTADDAAQRGQFLDAAHRFDEAAATTSRIKDRDEARHAAAGMLARAGHDREAIARLDALASETPPGPEAGSAAYDAAMLRVRVDDQEGWHGLDVMLHRFPTDGYAAPALHHILVHLDETGPGATLTYLRLLEHDLKGTEREEEVLYEIAVRQERAGEPAAARATFLEVATRWPYPAGVLWDDALYHASLVDDAMGHTADAIADLDRMLERRERAVFAGSYERPRYAEAQLRKAELYRRLGDHARAEAAYHELYAHFLDTPTRDRGLFEEAKLLRGDGDTSTACARLETLVKEFPASRYAACAVVDCPTLTVHPGPEAPKQCHPYLERESPLTK
jgi:TolA-binding protein